MSCPELFAVLGLEFLEQDNLFFVVFLEFRAFFIEPLASQQVWDGIPPHLAVIENHRTGHAGMPSVWLPFTNR